MAERYAGLATRLILPGSASRAGPASCVDSSARPEPIASNGPVSSDVAELPRWRLCRRHDPLTFTPSEEVPVSSSQHMQGLLIAENAG